MMVALIIFGILMPLLTALLTWQLVVRTLPSAIARYNERPPE